MPDIILQPNNNDRFGDNLRNLFNLLEQLNEIPIDSNTINIQFNDLRFIHPLYALALSSLITKKRNEGIRVNIQDFHEITCSQYLNIIHFPNGIELNDRQIRRYQRKTYIPIVKFPAGYDGVQNQIISHVTNLIENNFDLDTELYRGLYWLISELTDNVIEHSHMEYGWITAQYFPNKHFIDVCIIDTGIGVLNSYIQQEYEISTHYEALENALQGLSAKDSDERGRGIISSKSVVMNGLQGTFFMYTGNAMVINNDMTNTPFNWDGVLVFFRINQNVENFSLYNYV